MSPPPPEAETVLFRPSKKRKIYRQRPSLSDVDTEPGITSPTSPPAPQALVPNALSIDELISSSSALAPFPSSETGLEGTPVSISEILRLRKKSKRVGGVEFKASGSTQTSREADGTLLVRSSNDLDPAAREDADAGGLAVRKFAPQTGAVGDVNKHM